MKKFLVSFFTCVFLSLSCGVGKKSQKAGRMDEYGNVVLYEYCGGWYHRSSLDSLCRVNGLPLIDGEDMWYRNVLMDFESNEMIYQWIYVESDSVIFVVTEVGNLYEVNKRIVK